MVYVVIRKTAVYGLEIERIFEKLNKAEAYANDRNDRYRILYSRKRKDPSNEIVEFPKCIYSVRQYKIY